MLSRLSIENFALIDRIEIEFVARLNVLTGETGAGKSILIDAIRFLLGERIDVRVSRRDKSCRVEGIFDIPEGAIKQHPDYAVFCEDEEEIIIRREINAQGKSRCWINNRSSTLANLKSISTFLLDIHGQYDHQYLLDPTSHIEIVDQFAQNEKLRETYSALYVTYKGFCARRDELIQKADSRERELDLVKHQVDELERAGLSEGEEEDLETERLQMANSEKLSELSSNVLDCLDDSDDSASGQIMKAFRSFVELARFDSSIEELKGDYENVQIGLEEIIRELRDYQEGLSFEPGRLREVEERLSIISTMKRKYGGSVTEVLAFYAEASLKYDQLENAEVYQQDVEKDIKEILPTLEKAARALNQQRRLAARELKKIIEQELKDLGISNAKFECEIKPSEYQVTGKDHVEFMISPNVGNPPLPLTKIISGGEASRVMLALKKALMKVDPVPTLIFDEIDANIGGRLGEVTGKKLKQISTDHQVLLITHLPQIASFADKHFKVTKSVRDGSTFTEYHCIEGDERVNELAQMMDGSNETKTSRQYAVEMLERVDKS